jgi:hypothetical protein
MKKFLFLTLFTLTVHSAWSQSYKLTIEIIEVCGYGGSDGDQTEDYRWVFQSKKTGITTTWGPERRIGLKDMAQGTCLRYDIPNTSILGSKLPIKIWDANYSYPTTSSISTDIKAIGFEKDCGNDLFYVSECDCNVLGTSCRGDDDHRNITVAAVTDLSVGTIPGQWYESSSIKIDGTDTKFSFKYRWRWTPPVPSQPILATGDVSNQCSGKGYTMVTSSPTPVTKYRWYSNTNDKQKIVGYNDTYDQSCLNWIATNCVGCAQNVTLKSSAVSAKVTAAIVAPPAGGGACDPILCDESRCLTQTPIYATDWVFIGETTDPSIQVTAPIVTTGKTTMKYTAIAVGSNGVQSITSSPPSPPVFIFPEGPTLEGFEGAEIPNNTAEASFVNDPIQHYTAIADTVSIFNPSIEVKNVWCEGGDNGQIVIKKVTGSGKYYYNLRKVSGAKKTYNINGADLSNNGNPGVIVTGGGGGPVPIGPVKGGALVPTAIVIEPVPIEPPVTTYDYIIFPDMDPNHTGPEKLSAGTYFLRIENLESPTGEDNGVVGDTVRMCYRTYVIHVKEPEFAPSTESIDNDASCFNGTDGQIEVKGSGGIGKFKFYLEKPINTVVGSYTTSPYKGSHIFNGLGEGNYYTSVEDELGCLSTKKMVSIGQPALLELNDPVSGVKYNAYDISCNGGNNGSINVAAIGGNGNYTFKLYKNNVLQATILPANASRTFTGLMAGTYEVRVDDGNSCGPVTKSITLNDPAALTISQVSVTPPICIGGNDGSLTVSGGGGVALIANNYRFAMELDANANLKNTSAGIQATYSGLSAGAHTIFIEDDNGCIFSNSFIVPINPNPLSASETGTQKPPSCPGLANGEFSISISNYQSTPNLNVFLYKNVNEYIEGKSNQTTSNITFISLEAGFYRVEVVDQNSNEKCTISIDIELLDRIDVLTLDMNAAIQPTCHGFDDGSIIYKATGGDAPYSFSADGVNFVQDSDAFFALDNLFKNLDQGYTVYVRDANYNESYPASCGASFNVKLDEPSLVTVSETIVNVKCFGESTGQISVLASGGTPANGYTYTWRKKNTTQILGTTPFISNQPVGDYELAVSNGSCPTKYQTFKITQPFFLEFKNVIPGRTTCSGRDDGFVTLEAKGGTPPYSYYVDGVPLQTGFFSGLAVGVHSARVTDQYGCSSISEFFNIEIGEVTLLLEEYTDQTCFEVSNGSIRLSAQGGTQPYQYSIDNGNNFVNINVFQNLGAGNYPAIVRDNTGCQSTMLEIQISSPELLAVNAQLVKSAACSLNIGAATFDITGGTAPFTSTWLDTNLQKVNPDSLLAGGYTVEVVDASGCYAFDNITIDDLPPHELSFAIHKDSYCNLPIGSAEVFVNGGVGPFSYQWNDSQNTKAALADNLKARVYSVSVTDKYRGCVQQIEVVVTDGLPLSAAQQVKNATCGQGNGEAEVFVSGGVPPYSYQWGASSNSLTSVSEGLFAGVHVVIISDNVGCTLDYNIVVSNDNGPSLESVSISASYCGLPTGEAEVAVSGGTAPYSYRWLGTTNEQIEARATALLQGNYSVEITDATGCILVVPVDIVDDESVVPSIGVLSTSNSACDLSLGNIEVIMTGGLPPYSYQWQTPLFEEGSKIENLAAGVYEVIGTDAKGCAQTLAVIIEDNSDPVLSFSGKTKSACDLALGTATVTMVGGVEPYSFIWDDPLAQTAASAKNLFAGTYMVFGQDANGCSTNVISIDIIDEEQFIISVVDIVPVKCHDSSDGEIEVTVAKGKAPFLYQWNDTKTQQTERATNLSAGFYSVTVTDGNGCENVLAVEVPAPRPVSLSNLSIKIPDCNGGCDGEIDVFGAGGTNSFIYEWSNGQTGSKVNGLCAGDYSVKVTDSNGCVFTENILLEEPAEIATTGIPKGVVLCEGQDFVLDAGIDWIDYNWQSTTGFTSTDRVITVSDPGSYYLTVHSNLNCLVRDTFLLENNPNLLQAEFLMSSEATVGDTVVAIDISWPLPEGINWEIPKEAHVLRQGEFYNDISFSSAGSYTVVLNASLGECRDRFEKTITIIESQGRTNGRTDGKETGVKALMLYPNPNSGYFTVSVELYKSSPVQLSVISLQNGLKVAEYQNEGFEKYEVSFDLPNLSKGVYIVNIRADGEEANVRFIVK